MNLVDGDVPAGTCLRGNVGSCCPFCEQRWVLLPSRCALWPGARGGSRHACSVCPRPRVSLCASLGWGWLSFLEVTPVSAPGGPLWICLHSQDV